MYVELAAAIVAPLFASCMPQFPHYFLHAGIVVQHPWRSDRPIVCGVYQCQGVCQFHGLLGYDVGHVGMLAYPTFVFFAYGIGQQFSLASLGIYEVEKSRKLWYACQ